jgi:trehalose 6-phosphate synthase/phosphatase
MKMGGSSFGTEVSESSDNMVQVTSNNNGRNKGGSESGSASPPVDMKQRIFFVCFHLPVIVTKNEGTGQWSAVWAESLLAKTKGSNVVRTHDAHWIGTVTTDPPITRHKDREAVRALLSAMDCTALFLEPHVLEAHYLGMCKQVLWPAFHNIDLLDLSTSGWMNDHSNKKDASNQQASQGTQEEEGGGGPTIASTSIFDSDWDQSRLDGWWDAYCTVNKAFADVLNGVLEAGDIMWVHDYHLSLLPKLVDEKEIAEFGQSTTKKVFFLHIPFPTSQIFRELECGEAILEGILHADVVGFHAFDHARHFLNAAKRILGLNYESMIGGLIGVQFGRKTVVVTMNNVSIESHIVEGKVVGGVLVLAK